MLFHDLFKGVDGLLRDSAEECRIGIVDYIRNKRDFGRRAAVKEGEPDARLKILPAGIEMDGVAGNFQRAVLIFPLSSGRRAAMTGDGVF